MFDRKRIHFTQLTEGDIFEWHIDVFEKWMCDISWGIPYIVDTERNQYHFYIEYISFQLVVEGTECMYLLPAKYIKRKLKMNANGWSSNQNAKKFRTAKAASVSALVPAIYELYDEYENMLRRQFSSGILLKFDV